MLELAGVVLLIGVVLAMAIPKIGNAMREYRLNIAARMTSDMIQRAKLQAISDNKTSSLAVDTTGLRMGIVVYNADGSINHIEYTPLPQGVYFAMPSGVTAPMTGVPVSSVVSFPALSGYTNVFRQNFNSRGFPAVTTDGDINVVYLTNGKSYRAITLSSVGGLRTWWWENGQWVKTGK